MCLIELIEAKEKAESTLGIKIPTATATDILMYTIRKCELNKKPKDYLPVLFENELCDHYMREAITAISMKNVTVNVGGVVS